MRDPLVISVNALGITQITAWGTSYLLPGRAGKADRSRDRLGHQHDLPRLQRRAGGDGRDLDLGRPADRPDRRARGDVDWHRHRLRRACSALSQVARRHDLLRGLGGDRRRHALLPLRRGVRRAGAGRAEPRARRHLLSHPLRRLRLDGVLGDRPLPERGLRLARHADASSRPINLAVCLPLNWFGLSRRERASDAAAAKAPRHRRTARCWRDAGALVGIALFALIMSLNGFVFGVDLAAARAAARGGGAGRRDGGVGRLAQGPWPVRRPAGRDFLRAKPQGDDRGAHRHRRAAGLPWCCSCWRAASSGCSSPSPCCWAPRRA